MEELIPEKNSLEKDEEGGLGAGWKVEDGGNDDDGDIVVLPDHEA